MNPPYLVHLLLVHLRALLVAELKRVAHGPLLGSLHGSLHELVIDALLHHKPGRGAAALAHVEKEAEVRGLHCLLYVGVLQHDGGGLAAQLKGDALDGVGGRPLDDPPDLGGPGEGDLVHVRVVGDGGARCLAVARHHVHHPGREAGLLDEACDVEPGERRLLGQLHDDGVTCGQGGAQLPGLHQEREIPGNYLKTISVR